MTKAVAEQRAHARFAPSVLRVDLEHEGERTEGYMMNLSLGGAFLALSDPPAPGTAVVVHVLLPWSLGGCALPAECVWQQVDESGRAIGAGLSFRDVPEGALSMLGAYLHRYQELASDITD